MSEIEFDEDKSILKPMESEFEVPKRGFEGWVYKTLPGTYTAKKSILLAIILVIFLSAIAFLMMGRYNQNNSTEKRNFTDRVLNTKINN